MKKIISLFIALLLFSSLNVSAFTDSKTCTIIGEMEYISYGGEMYYPIENTYNLFLEYDNYQYLEYEFEDKEFKEKINNIDVSVYNDCDYIIEAYVQYGSVDEYIYYVRSDKKEWMKGFMQGKNASHIMTENQRAYVKRSLDFRQVEDWLKKDNKVSVTANELKFYIKHPVHIVDSSKVVRLQVGDVYENGTDFYFVRYSDYSLADLFGNGNYPNLSTAYKLTDQNCIEEIKQTYSEYAVENFSKELTEDEAVLDGVLNGFTKFSLIVVIAILFVLMPLAATILSLIFLFIKKASPMYKGWLKAIIILAVIVIACSVPIIIILF